MSNGFSIRYHEVNVFSRGDGVETRLLVGKGCADETPFTSGTTVFPKGCGAPLHSHNCAEQVTILEGTAEAMIGGETIQLSKLDTSFVPANAPHYFRNTGDTPLVILWIYGARDVTRTFTETGETVPHMSSGDQV
ncbi:cupin domain-containing protein [Parasedimentitalea marina]|uniref:Cupin domain-containing protein n=1 Tax=Parasedimentitalea marina TaxID=2483033 RepID=A0A3T0N820_9RHOB|nr:cupin domain-containing protein [Parasedimentitalea marina]AZV80180.1 cupin domain-containing protein [Parasedimentitalea marina]